MTGDYVCKCDNRTTRRIVTQDDGDNKVVFCYCIHLISHSLFIIHYRVPFALLHDGKCVTTERPNKTQPLNPIKLVYDSLFILIKRLKLIALITLTVLTIRV